MTKRGFKGAKLFLGKPCRRGHSGLRYTVGGKCVECVKRRYLIPFEIIQEAAKAKAKAKAQGLNIYLGRPCFRGHSGLRFLSGGCIVCKAESNAKYQKSKSH